MRRRGRLYLRSSPATRFCQITRGCRLYRRFIAPRQRRNSCCAKGRGHRLRPPVRMNLQQNQRVHGNQRVYGGRSRGRLRPYPSILHDQLVGSMVDGQSAEPMPLVLKSKQTQKRDTRKLRDWLKATMPLMRRQV